MARVKLTEYRAKKILVEGYRGVQLHLDSINKDIKKLSSDTSYIVKVDQGIKKRGKQGLVRLNVRTDDAMAAVRTLANRGFDTFIAEPMFPHEDNEERYLSVERVRDGVKILYSPQGGVDIEDHPEAIQVFSTFDDVPLPKKFVQRLLATMDSDHLSFVEINPLVVRDDEGILLDAAVLADSPAEYMSSWSSDDIAEVSQKTDTEVTISELNTGSSASFSFRVLNKNGSVWLLLSGGGASITIADEAANRQKAELIGNYGEYSGGPTREEAQVYAEAVICQMLESSAAHKALIVAGGVANFTDVKKTFGGVIDALAKYLDQLQAAQIKVYVRRGGPNEKEGLAAMESFLKKHGIYGSVHGSDTVLTEVVDEALDYVDA